MRLIRRKGNKQEILTEHLDEACHFLDRLIGLLKYKDIDTEKALLFQGCNSVHTIGMRFSIDVIFLDGSGKVLKVYPSMRPGRIMFLPVFSARSVIEAKEGFADRHRIKKGDVLCWDEA